MERGEAGTELVKLINMGGLQYRMPEAGKVRVSLVIGHDQDDIGPAAGKSVMVFCVYRARECSDKERNNKDLRFHIGGIFLVSFIS
jgi:hypothetical protein